VDLGSGCDGERVVAAGDHRLDLRRWTGRASGGGGRRQWR
jgi:hypothetical protein